VIPTPAQFARLGFAIAIGLSAACWGCRNSVDSAVQKSIALVSGDVDPGSPFTIAAGDLVNITWPASESDLPVWLVYREMTGDTETVISSTAEGGTFEWLVPHAFDPDTDYEIRQYDPQESTLLARSATFRVLGSADAVAEDANTNALPPGSACSNGFECDDGLYCNGQESCARGVCSNGVPPCPNSACDETQDSCGPVTCAADEDCPEAQACATGICVEMFPGTNGLAGHATFADGGGVVDFAQPLIVGTTLRLSAPGLGSSGFAPPSARLLDAGCACQWSVDATTIGLFDAADVCSTGFSVTAAGTFDLIVDTDCAGQRLRYRQSARAEYPAPATPSMELLALDPVPPYVVRMTLRLKDAQGAVIPDGVALENFQIAENGVPVDFTETSRFLAPAANLPLRVAVVLDYTTSMRARGAVGAMVAAAGDFVTADHFTATHHFAIVEFHDRTPAGEGFSLVQGLTAADAAGKAQLAAAIPRADELESGLTRVWDAVALALATLAEVERETGEVRAVIFLTDGRDTTSDAAPLALAADAAADGVTLYPVGFGNVADTESLLRSMADQTGGAYFPAAGADDLLGIFATIADDLRGQWNLSYVTPRNSGAVSTQVTFNWAGAETTLETQFEAGQLAGDIHTGRISVRDRAYNPYTHRTQFVLHAEYVPRNIDRLRFRFAHGAAELTLQDDGGLTAPATGWSVTPTGNGSYLLLNPNPLTYGAFGNIGVASVPGDVPQLQVTHDDTLYDFTAQPKAFSIGGDLWAAPYTLTTTVSPDDLGLILINPDKTGPEDPGYGHGETVTLTAIGTNGVFQQWSGDADRTDNAIQLIMDGDKSATANFTATP
jgi:hypothetical protein